MFCYSSLSLFQSSRYDYDNYNCVHMSRDIAPYFKAMGIETYFVRGARSSNKSGITAHMWLMLDIPILGMVEFEPTNLMFQKNSDRYCVYNISKSYDFLKYERLVTEYRKKL